MRRRSGRKQRRGPARRGSALGSIIAFPFVALVSIVKLPLVLFAFVFRAVGLVGLAFIKFLPAAVGAVGRAIAAVFALLRRIPFGAIGKIFVWCIALIWRIVASMFAMLFRVVSDPRGRALWVLVLIVVLAAAYPESRLGIVLVAAAVAAGAFWMNRQPGSIRAAWIPRPGSPNSHTPRILNTRDLAEIYALTPQEFEWFVRDILTDMGYRNLSVVGGAGDLGVDIVGQDPIGRSCVVQCKRYLPGNRVGSRTVQHFLVMKNYHHKVERGLIVTTSGFTQPAIEVAKANDIELVDGSDIVRMIRHRAASRGRLGSVQ